jgi:putative heme-binding domain-containing protein
VHPSKAIAPEFIPYVLETKAGQVYAGFLIEKTADHVVLKDVKSQLVRVASDDVEALVAQQKSLMPELILSEVTAQDAADLLAFLTTLK